MERVQRTIYRSTMGLPRRIMVDQTDELHGLRDNHTKGDQTARQRHNNPPRVLSSPDIQQALQLRCLLQGILPNAFPLPSPLTNPNIMTERKNPVVNREDGRLLPPAHKHEHQHGEGMPPPQPGDVRVRVGRGQEGQGQQRGGEEVARGEQDGEPLLDDDAELGDVRRGRRAAPQYGDAPEAKAEGDACGLGSVRCPRLGKGLSGWGRGDGYERT